MLVKKFLSDVYCSLIINLKFVPLHYRKKAKNPCWVLMFLFSRFYWIRKTVIFFYKSNSLEKLNIHNSIFKKTNIQYIVKNIEKEGFYQGLQIPKQYVDQIIDFASDNDCYGEGNIKQGFRWNQYLKKKTIYGDNIMRGEYNNVFDNCSAIKTISQDSFILSIAEAYLKNKPVLMNTRLWWNFVVNDDKCDLRKGARTFHYDPDDYSCIAFAFYITNVNFEGSGTHVCVRGSHKKKKMKRMFSLSLNTPDTEIVKDYGKENIVEIRGKSGYGYVEDRFIFHKANSPSKKERLILYIQFGINNYHKNLKIIDDI